MAFALFTLPQALLDVAETFVADQPEVGVLKCLHDSFPWSPWVPQGAPHLAPIEDRTATLSLRVSQAVGHQQISKDLCYAEVFVECATEGSTAPPLGRSRYDVAERYSRPYIVFSFFPLRRDSKEVFPLLYGLRPGDILVIESQSCELYAIVLDRTPAAVLPHMESSYFAAKAAYCASLGATGSTERRERGREREEVLLPRDLDPQQLKFTLLLGYTMVTV